MLHISPHAFHEIVLFSKSRRTNGSRPPVSMGQAANPRRRGEAEANPLEETHMEPQNHWVGGGK